MTKLIFIVLLLSFGSYCNSQIQGQSSCYQATIGENEHVFTKVLHYPRYKGGSQGLNLFLANEIDIQFVSTYIPDSVRVFEDSISVRFVISRAGTMSNLSVKGNSPTLSGEIKKALIKSACHWVPGGTERNLNAWYNGTVYFRLEKRSKACTLTISCISNDE